MNEETIIADMVDAIVSEVSPEKIILFGSRARGMARPDADVDLLIIERRSPGEYWSRRREITRILKRLLHFPVGQDILVYTPEDEEKWRGTTNHVIARALREGKVLYERS